jgi:hypothetical protein
MKNKQRDKDTVRKVAQVFLRMVVYPLVVKGGGGSVTRFLNISSPSQIDSVT